MKQSNEPDSEQKLRWLRAAECAELMGVSVDQLARWRVEGIGPRFSKLGHRIVVYKLADVHEWIEARARQSTTAHAAA